MRAGFKINRLSVQITAIVVFLFVTTVIALSAIGRISKENELLEITRRYSAQVLGQVSQNIEHYVRDMERIAEVADQHPDILRLLFAEGDIQTSSSLFYGNSQPVRQLLYGISATREEVENIIIIGKNGAMSDIRNHYFSQHYTDLRGRADFRAAVAAEGQFVFTPPHMQQYRPELHVPVVSIARTISMHEGGQILGVVIIELSLEALEEIGANVILHQTGYIFIVDDWGNYIYHPDHRYVSRAWGIPAPNASLITAFYDDEITGRLLYEEGAFIAHYPHTEERYVVHRRIEGTPWHAVGVIPHDEILAPARAVGNAQLAMGIPAAITVACLIAFLLSRMIFSPLKRLHLVMDRVEKGDFDVEVPAKANNEIGEFSRGFNHMTGTLKQLMESLVQNEKAKRKAELAALHAQINPHFLYNTLDTIVWLAEYDPPQAAEMTGRLAKFFRLSLGTGSDLVSVAQEMEYIEHYLSMQKVRYKTKFEYRTEYEPRVASSQLPKLSVQVLVENAIYHGVKLKRQKCQLLVRAFEDCGEAVVQVVDDGIGMSDERLLEIMSGNYKPSRDWGGIGVRNVQNRLSIYFGEKSKLEYYSIQSVGTIAEIRIPLDPEVLD